MHTGQGSPRKCARRVESATIPAHKLNGNGTASVLDRGVRAPTPGWGRGPIPVGGGGVQRHRPAESCGVHSVVAAGDPARLARGYGRSGPPALTTSRSSASGETRTEVAGPLTWRLVRVRPGAPAAAHDRACPRVVPGPAHPRRGVRARPARPHTAPSAGASDRNTSGSCPSRPARARRASPANLRSTSAARSEPPTARTVHQHGSRAPRACRGAPIPRHEGPGRVSRPPKRHRHLSACSAASRRATRSWAS
jgi:hypothetical protein